MKSLNAAWPAQPAMQRLRICFLFEFSSG